MKLDVQGFLNKLPAVVAGISAIVGGVKGANKGDKVDAVLAAIPQSITLAEYGIGADLFNDANIQVLLKNLANAQHDVQEAVKALRAGVLNKAA